jgi:hypothetical protein
MGLHSNSSDDRSPSFAQDEICGGHSVDALFDDALALNSDLLGEHQVSLIDGKVFGVPIADVTSGMSLYRVDDQIGIIISGGGLDGSLEFEIDRVPKADALDFQGAGFAITLDDIGVLSGCADVSGIPQYLGAGDLLTPDGPPVPATVRTLLWVGADHSEGTAEQPKRLFAVGVVRSEFLDGRFYVL